MPIQIFKYRLLCILFIFFNNFSFSQQEKGINFKSPLEIPLYLSGNYGELRATHFHAGIDIKTNGEIGQKITSIDDGYVSRIKIQSGGYGKAIYIHHPNGYTSVFAHLNNYIPKIEEYVKKVQYQNQQYEIDVYLERDKFIIKKGELVGYSGNTGRSGGPHLHFEIRETNKQIPLNVLKFNFNIKDNIPPKIQKVVLYPLKNNSFINFKQEKTIYNPRLNDSIYSVSKNPVNVSGAFGIGMEVYDFLNFTNNRCGIYSVEMFIDSIKYYHHQIDRISFDETRYINSFVDYEEKIKNNNIIQKFFIQPNNQLSIYRNVKNNGIIEFNDTLIHKIDLIVSDVNGNRSYLKFDVINKNKANNYSKNSNDSNYLKIFYYATSNFYENSELKLNIPENALYEDLKFNYVRIKDDSFYYSDIHYVHNKYTPVHNHYSLYIKPKRLDPSLYEKALIASIDNNEIKNFGGFYTKGFIKASLREFGTFVILIDTIPPSIKPVNFVNRSKTKDNQILSFLITDNLSGIKTYNGYIDDQWALFEYDLKSDMLFYYIDPEKLEKNKMHRLKLVIEDEKENISQFTGEFFY